MEGSAHRQRSPLQVCAPKRLVTACVYEVDSDSIRAIGGLFHADSQISSIVCYHFSFKIFYILSDFLLITAS